jgi:hypothetical protein
VEPDWRKKSLFPSVFPPSHCQEVNSPALFPTMIILSHLRPKAMEPDDHGLKALKVWAKINLSSVKLFHSGICHSYQKLTQWEITNEPELGLHVVHSGWPGGSYCRGVWFMFSLCIMWIIIKENIFMYSLCLKTERKEPYMVVHACSASDVGGLGTSLCWAKSETLTES